MLFWEALQVSGDGRASRREMPTVNIHCRRLPYDRRCSALTRSGVRCRGRIREGREFCPFHDPEVLAEARRRRAHQPPPNRRRLSHLPDGYLRKLKSRRAVGEAMDRLYRELRLEIISPEMGRVLFGILTRLLDSQLVESGPCPERSKAARLSPKLSELLTRSELAAWRRAVENATSPSQKVVPRHPAAPFERAMAQRNGVRPAESDAVSHPLPAAS